jgi:hypothetical protein
MMFIPDGPIPDYVLDDMPTVYKWMGYEPDAAPPVRKAETRWARLRQQKQARLRAAAERKARLDAMTPSQRRKAIRASKAESKARKEAQLGSDW